MQYVFTEPTNYILTAPAVNDPVSLEEVKAFCKITSISQDNLIGTLIKSVTDHFEKFTGRDLINKTYKCYLDKFPDYDCGILIKKSRLQSISDIKYFKNGILEVWDSENYYITDESIYSSIYLTDYKIFPINIDQKKQAIAITFIAGYGEDATFIPEQIKLALMNHVNYLLENRGDCEGEGSLPLSIKSIYSQFKIINFGVC